MAERDSFELRLAEALRAYAEDAPTNARPAELVGLLASTHPRGKAAIAPLHLGTAPVVVWLMVLGALVLTASSVIVGAAILRSRDLAVLPVPTAVVRAPFDACPSGSDQDQPGPAGQVRPPIPTYAAPMAFDRRAGRIVLLASGDGAGTQTWTFDVCTNTWAQMHPYRQPRGMSWVRQLVYDDDSDRTVAITEGGVWEYDLEADAWTAKGRPPVSLERQIDLTYDAASGLIVVMSSTSRIETDPWELWTYDVETDTWTGIHQAGGPAVAPDHAYQWLAYDASVDRLVWYALASPTTTPWPFETWLFDLRAGTWSKSAATTPRVNAGYGNVGGEMAYDEATRQTVVFSRGRVIAYDAAADRWDVLAEGWDPDQPGGGDSFSPRYTDLQGPSFVYDPVNKRLIVYGGTYPTEDLDGEGLPVWVRANDVLAFDPVTRQWSLLLPASVVEPT